jgi:hypothetical protein
MFRVFGLFFFTRIVPYYVRICNEIKLKTWLFRYHNRFKYPLLVYLVEIPFSSIGKVVAFGAEGTGFDPNL